MELIIPEGAQVHITIGAPAAPMLALPAPTQEAAPSKTRRPLLKGVLASFLLFGTYTIGKHTGSVASSVQTASAGMPAAAQLPEQHAFPDRPLPRPTNQVAASDPTQIPSEFTQQLRQAPTVVPPPGQAAPSAARGEDAFGLHP